MFILKPDHGMGYIESCVTIGRRGGCPSVNIPLALLQKMGWVSSKTLMLSINDKFLTIDIVNGQWCGKFQLQKKRIFMPISVTLVGDHLRNIPEGGIGVPHTTINGKIVVDLSRVWDLAPVQKIPAWMRAIH